MSLPPIRVLHITAVEASNYYLNSLADQLHPERATLTAVTLGRQGGFTEELRRRGVEVQAEGVSGRRLLYPLAIVRIAATARRAQVQVIHGHLFEPSLLAAVISRLGRWRFVTTRHYSDAVHRIPQPWRRRAYSQMDRYVSSVATRIIAPAERARAVLVAEGVSPTRVSLIPYPQDRERFANIRPAEDVRRDLSVGKAPLLVCVSRLHQEKGLSVLLRALADLPEEIRLVIVGEGAERTNLELQARALGVERRTRFLGWRADAVSILAAADVVVHPSLHEALPSAVIEAVGVGRPVVATDVSGIADVLGREDFGRIVPPGDSDALACAVRETLADRQAAEAKADIGRRHLLQHMDPSRVAEAHMECYRQVLAVSEPRQ